MTTATPSKETPQDTAKLYRQVELKLESIVERLLSCKTGDADNVLSTAQALLERIFLTTAMRLSGDNITRASHLLGINRNTLSKKLRDLERRD